MRTSSILCFLLLIDSPRVAQAQALDTLKVFEVGETVVTATRSPILLKDSPASVEVLNLRHIESANGSSVADVLQDYSSIFLKDYGANGALKSVSLRGTASEHLLVLINGNRINSFQNGLVDLSLLPSSDIERIEIVRGGNSALYGADALGGVLNILTRQSREEMRAKVELGAGSFGYERYRLEAQARVDKAGLLGGFASERGRDDFPLSTNPVFPQAVKSTRNNSDFVRHQAYFHGSLVTGGNSLFTLSANYVRANRGVPGDLRFASDAARQRDEDMNLLVAYNEEHSDALDLTIRGGFHYSLQTYLDPTFLINSYYKNLFLNLNPQVRVRLGKSDHLILGGELAQGNLYGNDFDGKILRVQKSLYASNEILLEVNRSSFDRLTLYQTLRYDSFSDVDHALMPKFGVNLRIMRDIDLRLRSSIGGNFRAPSFNDLYYRGFSNPNLKPERSTSFDVGLTGGFEYFGSHQVDLTYFRLTTRNRILFDLSTFLPVNIGESKSTGLEASYLGTFFDRKIEFGVNYTLSDSRKTNKESANDPTFEKRLLYLPEDVVVFNCSFRISPITVNLGHSFIGRRYVTNDNSAWLPSYHLTRANIVLHVPIEARTLFFKGEVSNLFDRGYEVLPYFPMPGQSFRFTVGVDY